MVKVLPFCFDQYFGPFTILLVEGLPEMGLLRHLSNDVFQSSYVQKYISCEGHLFLKMLKI